MDIVKRLRSWVLPTLYDDTLDVMNEAADEIERLREALKEIVKRDAGVNKFGEKDMSTLGWIAYNALGKKE